VKKIFLLILVILITGCTTGKIEKSKELKQEVIEEEINNELSAEDYISYKVDESGEVPIMMYHGIQNKKNSETGYIGGNIDRDGYQRTSESFINDLEFYYKSGYRMIRLTDYIDGNIDVELGKSPIILTFDDGLSNNIKVNGIDEEGDLIIDPNSVIGILESFKEKYPDYNITATFFINDGLFSQPKYNDKIVKWLIENGYDVGNHTYSHVDFTKVDSDKTEEEIGKLYNLLDSIIPGEYINVVALPFGSPYKLDHDNMPHIFKANYNSKEYITKGALRVGWKAESSPYIVEFNPNFLKRIRAYDNNGEDFDIEMNFKLLENTRYISDGNGKNIVIPKSKIELIRNIYKDEMIVY